MLSNDTEKLMQTFLDANRKRKVLAVDDEIINLEIISEILANSYEVDFAYNGKEAMELLSDPEADYSLVLLDLMMPVMDGFEVIRLMRADVRLRKFPIIVMTSDKAAEVRSLRMGAADFITKPYDMPEVVLARCQAIIELSEDRSIIRSTERDPLTGLYSKDYFFVYIRRFLPQLTGDMDALVLDFDRFNIVNELLGREEGNRILKQTAELINTIILQSRGIACRTDGDIFYVYCERREDYESCIKEIQDTLNRESPSHSLRLRAGLYQPATGDRVPEAWFDRAKTACDRLRDRYNHCVGYYSRELYERFIYEEKLIADIDEAIAQHQLLVYYQPKYDIRGDKPVLTSAEALVRWDHTELGFISPGDFIPLFESNGLIRKIDRFVWRESAAQIRRIKDIYHVNLPVSVNVSRINFFDPELEDVLLSVIRDYDLQPRELILEITESAYANDEAHIDEVIADLRSKGFRIGMDDFGTGYSSLNMLTEMPIDILKLDMKFIRNMLVDEKSRKLIELVLDIARFLNVPVVAEGVEEEPQYLMLKEMGLDIIQGYYFSAPLPADEFERLIEKSIDSDTINQGII